MNGMAIALSWSPALKSRWRSAVINPTSMFSGARTDPERWAEVRTVLQQALELGEAERALYLDQACRGDAEMRDEVQSLLDASKGPHFLDEPLQLGGDPDATQTIVVEPDADAASGQKISHYQIVRKIAEGRMGAVYEAVDENLGRPVALKLISKVEVGAQDRKRFEREARAASALNHPNIVTIYEYGTADGTDFIAMEYVEGLSLDRVLRNGDRPLARMLDYAWQTAKGLAKAHGAGIVHRDLKPGNIMITPDGVAKILDFGLAKQESSGEQHLTALTRAGVLVGTPAYMSPEQAMGEATDARSDIFSFGLILYEMVCGKRAFAGENATATMRQIVNKEAAPVSSLAPEAPAAVAELIERCLVKDREARLGWMAAAVDALAMVVAPRTLTSLDVPVARSWRWRVPWKWAAVAAAAVVVGTGVTQWERVFPPTVNIEVPKTSQDFAALGRAYLARYDKKGNQDKASEAFQKALQLDEDNASALVGLARVELARASSDSQVYRQALNAANQAISKSPYLAAAHAARAGALLALGQNADGKAAAERAIELDAKSDWGYYYRAVALEKSRDLQAAERDFRKAAGIAPQEWAIVIGVGNFLYRAGRYAEAVSAFEGALKAAPDNGIVLRDLGGALHMAGRDEDAASALQRSLEIAPSASVFSNLGTLLYYLGRFEDSAQAFERSLAIDANSYLRWGNLGDAYRWAPGKRPKAADAYVRAIQLADEALKKAPGNDNIRTSLALYMVKAGRQADALSTLRGVSAESRTKPAILFKMAMVQELSGQRSAAMQALTQAVQSGYPVKEIEIEPEFRELRKAPDYHLLAARAADK